MTYVVGSDSFLTWQLLFNRDAKQFEGGHGNKRPLCFYILAEKLFGNWNKNIIVFIKEFKVSEEIDKKINNCNTG